MGLLYKICIRKTHNTENRKTIISKQKYLPLKWVLSPKNRCISVFSKKIYKSPTIVWKDLLTSLISGKCNSTWQFQFTPGYPEDSVKWESFLQWLGCYLECLLLLRVPGFKPCSARLPCFPLRDIQEAGTWQLGYLYPCHPCGAPKLSFWPWPD